MSSFTMEGEIYKIFPTQEIPLENGGIFKKREFILKVVEGPYENFPKFEVVKDNCIKLEPFEPGDKVEVVFFVRGRIYKNKKKEGEEDSFTGLTAWRVNNLANYSSTAPATENIKEEPEDNSNDGLPF